MELLNGLAWAGHAGRQHCYVYRTDGKYGKVHSSVVAKTREVQSACAARNKTLQQTFR